MATLMAPIDAGAVVVTVFAGWLKSVRLDRGCGIGHVEVRITSTAAATELAVKSGAGPANGPGLLAGCSQIVRSPAAWPPTMSRTRLSPTIQPPWSTDVP